MFWWCMFNSYRWINTSSLWHQCNVSAPIWDLCQAYTVPYQCSLNNVLLVCLFACYAESEFRSPGSRIYLFRGAIWPPLSSTTLLDDKEEKVVAGNSNNGSLLGKRKQSNSPSACAQIKEPKMEWPTHAQHRPFPIPITKNSLLYQHYLYFHECIKLVAMPLMVLLSCMRHWHW